ncbi:hypothetical protein [Streptomyces sp. NBC_01092]|uniref:hypothetical protein n=1 Tax=Streptomyces sp. NBC_01092 TaxID=2903748 RepID=UPI0038652EF5|nr:hypothetical protein OG254_12400 [Streptomyces sp. NBC_01092]
MSWQETVPNPERFAPGSPWSTHKWDDQDPYWCDSAWWCQACGTGSFKDAAHEPCPGPQPDVEGAPSRAVLVAAK